MPTGDLIIPDGFGNAVISWQFTGRSNPLTIGIGFSPSGSTDPVAMANAIDTALSTAGGPCVSTNMNVSYTYTGVVVTYNDGGTLIGGASTNAAVHGSMSGASPMIISSSVLVQKRTGLVGKHYRGRIYSPKMYGTESGVDALGNIDSSEVTAIQAMWDAFLATAEAGSPSIIPNVLHHVPAVGTAPVPTPITSLAVQSKTATQRRRLR